MNTQLMQPQQYNLLIKKQTRTVSIRLYVSTVVFLGCTMVWMQLSNTNVLINNNNNNNNNDNMIGGLDGPTMYGQLVKAATTINQNYENDLLELCAIVELQGEKMKEQVNHEYKPQTH